MRHAKPRDGADLLLLLSLLGAPACVVGELDQQAPGHTEIVGGGEETEHPAVGAFVLSGLQLCTGTVVEPGVVVSAAHCLRNMPDNVQFFVGTDTAQPATGKTIDVAWIDIHPDFVAGPEGVQNDVAVVHLVEDPGVEPIPLNRAALEGGAVGREALFVGYGASDAPGGGWLATGEGRKRSVYIPITGLEGQNLIAEAGGRSACFGDAGGPALLELGGELRLVGVTSLVGDDACSSFTAAARTDLFTDFLDESLTRTEPPPEPDICEVLGMYGDGVCNVLFCDRPDPDCESCAGDGSTGDGYCDVLCPRPDPDCSQ